MPDRTCSVDGCESPRHGRGFCIPHYNRWYKHGDPLAGGSSRRRGRVCSLDGCDAPHQALGFCQFHYVRARANDGDPLADVPPREMGSDRPIRTCSRCKEQKPRDRFGMRSNGRWYRSRCRDCDAEVQRARHAAEDPVERSVAYWRRMLVRNYGITHHDYERMLDGQEGVCAICGADEPGAGRENFCVDHDHVTGHVRGLLCNACNHGIGHLGDNADGVRRALAYLEAAEARA